MYDNAQEEQAAFPMLRLTEAKTPCSDDTLEPICRSEDIAPQLELPLLSDKTFFYYVEHE